MRILTCLFALCIASSAWADDEITLKNGDRISGKILPSAGGKLAIETAHSGIVQVDWAQVVKVTSDARIKVKLSTGVTVEGKLATTDKGKFQLVTDGVGTDLDPATIVTINEPPVAWHGNVDLAMKSTDGNTHNSSILLNGQAVRATDDDEILVKLQFRYAETHGFITERNTYGLGKYSYKFTPDLYGYASFELFSDKFKDLDYRTIFSIGAGYAVERSALEDISVEAGIAMFTDNFHIADDDSHLGARIAAKYRRSLPLGIEFTDSLTIYPNFETTSDYQVHNELAFSTSLGKGWALSTGIITDIDNKVPSGIEKKDDTFFLSLGYKF